MRTLVVIIGALAIAVGSSRAQRLGPDQGVYCAIGKVNGIDVYCPKPKLNGGWPAPYLFDLEGVSTEWKLRFFEDDFRVWSFVADVSFYYLLLTAVMRLLRRSGGGRRADASAAGVKP